MSFESEEGNMELILALRPFVPARDYALSQRFYQRLEFRLTHSDDNVAFFKHGPFGFILQNFYLKDMAENFVMQLMVRDVDSWWARVEPDKLAEEFGVRPAQAPEMQPWGLRVGFVFDPSRVLWHIAEAPF